MSRIWIATKDPGGHNALSPVQEVLENREHSVLSIVHGKAIDMAHAEKIPHVVAHDASPEPLLHWLTLPDIFITSMCGEGGVGRNLIPELKKRGIPTIGMQDYWGTELRKAFADPLYWPRALCVQDPLGMELVQEAWPTYSNECIKITGQPAFDSLITYAKVDTQAHFRTELGCTEKWPIVLYAGQLQESAETLLSLIRTLNQLPHKVYLIPLLHPRLPNDAPEEVFLHSQAVAEFHNGIVVDRDTLSTDQLVATSNVVVTMFSTVLITAAYLEKECVSVLLPNAGEAQLKKAGLEFLPMEKLRCCAVARNQKEIDEIIPKALSKKGLGLRRNQRKHFANDGKSAVRIADVVEDLVI